MNHSEAVQQMAAERYLLGELTSEQRDAFEEHYFDCPECALDLRAGGAFVDEARRQLPQMNAAQPARKQAARSDWFAWLRPAFAAPVFAMLLAVVAWQNFATIPHLRSAAAEPRLGPWMTLHLGTRGAAPMPVQVTRGEGFVLVLDVPPETAWASYAFVLDNPQGRPFWTRTITPAPDQTVQTPLSLTIPGTGLQQGTYTLTISGITPQGSRTELDRRVLDVHFN
jgi:hypothetical protein